MWLALDMVECHCSYHIIYLGRKYGDSSLGSVSNNALAIRLG